VVLDKGGRPRRSALVRWLSHRQYAMRGRRDGRRGLPMVLPDAHEPSPTLLRLNDAITREVDALYAEEAQATVATRVSLARLLAPEGDRAREEERLEELLARVDRFRAVGPATDRRFGEEELPDQTVRLRREREHDLRLRSALKRVEDQRTLLASLMTEEEALFAHLREARRVTDSQVHLVGAERQAEAASYLDGALATHPQRRLLSMLTADLTPTIPSHPTTPHEDKP
jgi:hypothetical protein